MHRRPSFPRHVLALPLLLALPAASAPPAGPKTQLWIDVDTHSLAGMPDLGALGGLATRMMGGGAPLHYPDTRVPMGSGKYLDVALYNSLQPGVEAEQKVPAGLGLGAALPLVPPVAGTAAPVERDRAPGQYTPPDGQMRMLFYWGCGEQVRPGQPREFSVTAKDGKVQVSGSNPQQGRYAPDRDIDPDPAYALWPNPKARARAPANASLVGSHQVLGPGVPESLKFDLPARADFMPAIALTSSGSLASGQTLHWQPVDRAQAYFLHAMGSRDGDVVIWTSAEVPDAGQGVVAYLDAGTVARWLKEKVLLPPSATSCAIPAGIFADAGGRDSHGGGGFLGMIAYGPETDIAWPPKPADPKQPWHPDWNVRVRTKSTAGAMLGMDLASVQRPDAAGATPQPQQPPAPQEGATKKLLKGLLRGL